MSDLRLCARVYKLENLIQQLLTGGTVVGGSTLRTGTLFISGIAASFGPTVMTGMPAALPGSLNSLSFVQGTKAFGVGESVTIDVRKKGGGSILTAPFAITSTTSAASVTSFLSDVASLPVTVGEELTISGVYVAGGAPNNPDFAINLTWA